MKSGLGVGDVDWRPIRESIVAAVADRPFLVNDVVEVVRPHISATMAARWGERRRKTAAAYERRTRGYIGRSTCGGLPRYDAATVGIRYRIGVLMTESLKRGHGVERLEPGVYRITDPEEFIR